MNRKDSVNNQEDAKHRHSDEFQGVIDAVVLVISQKTAITEMDAKVRAITQVILQLAAKGPRWQSGNTLASHL